MEVVPSVIQQSNPSVNVLLIPNDLFDLTQFGINKVLNKELLVVI